MRYLVWIACAMSLVACKKLEAPPAPIEAESAPAEETGGDVPPAEEAPATVAAVRVPVVPQAPPVGPPDATVDLGTAEGMALLGAEWRYADARIVEIESRAPGPDRRPSGEPNRTHDVLPKAGGRDFDDSGWEVLDPTTLDARRGGGRVSFNWYRARLTVPDRIGDVDTRGATLAFEVVVDDYAEVWVDGELTPKLGQPGGTVAAGFNAPNRVILTEDAQPGDAIQIAVFGINGPISLSPSNFIWIRSATLDVYREPTRTESDPSYLVVDRRDDRLGAIVPEDAAVERLAAGFSFIEGPVWHDGGLFFSDPNNNQIYRYLPDGRLWVFRSHSGYAGTDIGRYHQPGSNGLAIDPEGRLTIAEHGRRRVSRLEPNGVVTVLADRYEGKRLNSPNDLVYRSDGTLYFTDPPFGLPEVFDDPAKELDVQGVFMLREGELTLASQELAAPNGLAFSPDESVLYVDNWEEERKVVLRYPVAEDGTLGEPETFFDMTDSPGEIALDGLKVDEQGHVYVSGPGGVWVLHPDGTHLGTLRFPELPANFAWGDDDGRSLYLTARTGLYRLRLRVPGAGRRAS
ncbi:MAG: SMP-30/gluconolactonase/LRE family protein [Sandaracinaceae bacterium]